MRRSLALLFCALALLSLFGCTGNSPAPAPTPAPTAAPATPEPTPASTPTPAPTPAPTPTPTPSPEPTPAPTPEPDDTLSVVRPGGTDEYPAYLSAWDLRGGGTGDGFTCLWPKEQVTAEYVSNAWIFRCVSDPEAAWLELSYVAGTDTEELLPGFMDGYLDFTEIEYSEAAALGRTRGNVGRVTASDDFVKAEGWLLDRWGGVVSAAFLCRKDRLTEEGALLTAMLDTVELQ